MNDLIILLCLFWFINGQYFMWIVIEIKKARRKREVEDGKTKKRSVFVNVSKSRA